MSTRPCCQVRARKIKHRWLCCQYVSVGSESPGARSLQGAPRVPGCRALICFFAQKGGGHAALWSNCWHRSTQMSGSGWQTSAGEGSPFCLVWRRCSPRAHLLSPWWEGHLSNGSASAWVPSLDGTSTYSYDPEQSCSVVSDSLQPHRP